jgi:hypothetical protein
MFNVSAPSWFQDAPCVGEDKLFFSAHPSKRRMAVSMCNNVCQHTEECLKFALDSGQTVGVWGGKTGPDLVRLSEVLSDVN